MSVKQSIKVANAGLSPILSVAQGTGAIEYEFTVSDFDIPSGSAAVAYNIQPTGNIVSQTCSISGNTITVKPPAYYFLRGKNYMQFQVSRSNEDLFSFLIEVWCAPNISQPEVIVAENPSLVSQLISDVGLLSSQLDNLLSIPSGSLSTSADAALADIKVGWDGTTYDTPGDAVRGQIGSLSEDLISITQYIYDVKKESINKEDTAVKSNLGKLEYANAYGLETYTYTINKYPTKLKVSGTLRGSSTWLAVTVSEDGTLIDRIKQGTLENVKYEDVEITIENTSVKSLVVTVMKTLPKEIVFARPVAVCFKSEYDSIQDKIIADLNKSWLNKIAVCFGDSITYGDNGLGNGLEGKKISWVTYLPILCGFTEAINLGYKGSTVAHYNGEQSPCFVDRLTTIVKGDLYIVMGGVNDHMKNIPLGNIGNDNNSTFIGALETVVKYIKSNYPESELLVCSSPKYIYHKKNSFWKNSQGLNQKDYADATKLVADRYSCDFLDLFNNSGISPFVDAQKTLYMGEGLHYLDKGYKRLAETRICPKINSMLIN